MIGVRRLWAAGGLVLMAGLLWLACNGGSSVGPGPSPVALAGSCQPIAEFERFRYTVTYTLDSPKPEVPVDDTAVGDPPFAMPPNGDDFLLTQVFAGSFQGPDRFQIEVETPTEEDVGTVALIILGDQIWVNVGSGWVMADFPNAFPPLGVCQSILSSVDFSGLDFSPQTANGQETRHVTIDEAQLDTAAVLFGSESDMGRLLAVFELEVWLAEDGGWPARLVAKSTGTYPSGRQLSMEISLEIKDIDASDISIEPPEV